MSTSIAGSEQDAFRSYEAHLKRIGAQEERKQIIEILTNSMSNGTSRGMRRAIKLIEGMNK
jgi:hypothetical protein